MSSDQKNYDELQLGDTVYEADAWEKRVCRRMVIIIETIEQWDRTLNRRCDTIRAVHVNGGILGGGKRLTKDNWGVEYFLSQSDARKVCVERNMKMKQEHKEEVEAEIERLQSELEESHD